MCTQCPSAITFLVLQTFPIPDVAHHHLSVAGKCSDVTQVTQVTGVTAGTAPLPDITEEDLQDTIRLLDAHSADAASDIGTNVSASCRRCRRRRRRRRSRYHRAPSSLSPRRRHLCQRSRRTTCRTHTPTTLHLTSAPMSLRPPSYSPASPTPPLSVHPLSHIPQLTDTQLIRFAISQLG